LLKNFVKITVKQSSTSLFQISISSTNNYSSFIYRKQKKQVSISKKSLAAQTLQAWKVVRKRF